MALASSSGLARALLALGTSALLAHAADARADDPPPAPTAAQPATGASGAVTINPGDVDLEKDARPSAALEADVAGPPPEAPPPPPYKKTLVLDSSLGALAFLGEFGKVAPPALWLRTQLGYELFKWFMLFGEGEIGFTDTSRSQDQPKTRAFPVFGFGGGARFTVRFTDRFGAYVQGSLGGMKADIRTGALRLIGHRDAEELDLYAGGRIGLEWYQIDRHFALGLQSGIRHAGGFKRLGAASDTPLAFDGGVSLRYAF